MKDVCPKCGAEITEATVACPACNCYIRTPAAAAAASSANTSHASAPVNHGAGPAVKLKTNRSLLKFILLSLITLGIYGIVVMSSISTDINTIASKYDGKKTMHYCLVLFIFSWLTFGIVPLVWSHRISARIGNELSRRAIDYSFGAGSFWLWNLLGSFIIVGPFVYSYKMLKAMNLLAADYNARG